MLTSKSSSILKVCVACMNLSFHHARSVRSLSLILNVGGRRLLNSIAAPRGRSAEAVLSTLAEGRYDKKTASESCPSPASE